MFRLHLGIEEDGISADFGCPVIIVHVSAPTPQPYCQQEEPGRRLVCKAATRQSSLAKDCDD